MVGILKQFCCAPAVVEDHDGGAENPTCRVSKGDRNKTVGKPGDGKQISLPEGNKAAQEDNHGAAAVTHTSQTSGENLADAVDNHECARKVHDLRAIVNDFFVVIEHCDEGTGKNDNNCSKYSGDKDRECNGNLCAFFDSVHALCTKILAGKGGCSDGNALHGQHDELVYLIEGAPAGHGRGAEDIDVRLNKYIGECGDCHLQCSGQADGNDASENGKVQMQFFKMDSVFAVGAHEHQEDQSRGNVLRNNSCICDACNTHVKRDDKYEVKNDIEYG